MMIRERTIGKTEWEDRWRRKYTGLYHLDSVGAKHKGLEILFVAPCTLTEEMDCRFSPAAMLKGGAANLFRRNLGRAGIGQEQWGYTTLVRYNVDKLKPKAADIRWSLPLFAAEIQRRKPKLIVCLGQSLHCGHALIHGTSPVVRPGASRGVAFVCPMGSRSASGIPNSIPEWANIVSTRGQRL